MMGMKTLCLLLECQHKPLEILWLQQQQSPTRIHMTTWFFTEGSHCRISCRRSTCSINLNNKANHLQVNCKFPVSHPQVTHVTLGLTPTYHTYHHGNQVIFIKDPFSISCHCLQKTQFLARTCFFVKRVSIKRKKCEKRYLFLRSIAWACLK